MASTIYTHLFGGRAPGPLMVGFHGWGGDHRTFAKLAGLLPEEVTLLAPDLPGYGASDPLSSWTLDAYIDRLEPFWRTLDERGKLPLVAVGSCSGALLLLETARRRPERFQAIVALEPFAWLPWYFRVFLTPVLGPLAYHSTFANPVGRAIGNRSMRQQRQADTDLTASFADKSPATTLGTLRVLAEMGDARRFEGCETQVRLLHGERTFAAVREGLPLWRSSLRALEIEEVPGVGHLPLEENPARVAEVLLALKRA